MGGSSAGRVESIAKRYEESAVHSEYLVHYSLYDILKGGSRVSMYTTKYVVDPGQYRDRELFEIEKRIGMGSFLDFLYESKVHYI